MSNASSADRPRGRRPAWLPLAVAAIVVPTVLAGLTLAWPRPQIEDGLTRAADTSLAAAGLAGTRVTFSGRDATVDGPAAAVEVVRGVTGVRVADGAPAPGGGSAPGSDPATASDSASASETAPAPEPAPPSAAGGLDDAARQQLAADVAALLAGAPITFEPNSPALTAAGSATVARVVERIAAAPGARLQVDGFVAAGPGDGRLTAQELSDRRAATVRDALVAGGVPADRVAVRGLGEGRTPVADAAGRRVDIAVVP